MNYVTVAIDQCKGCRVCVNTCPHHCLVIGSHFNTLGYQHVVFKDDDCCTACGMCFYVCPEPGALTVFKDEKEMPERESGEGEL